MALTQEQFDSLVKRLESYAYQQPKSGVWMIDTLMLVANGLAFLKVNTIGLKPLSASALIARKQQSDWLTACDHLPIGIASMKENLQMLSHLQAVVSSSVMNFKYLSMKAC